MVLVLILIKRLMKYLRSFFPIFSLTFLTLKCSFHPQVLTSAQVHIEMMLVVAVGMCTNDQLTKRNKFGVESKFISLLVLL